MEKIETRTLNVKPEDIYIITDVKKLDVSSWEEIKDLVAAQGRVLIGPFQIGKQATIIDQTKFGNGTVDVYIPKNEEEAKMIQDEIDQINLRDGVVLPINGSFVERIYLSEEERSILPIHLNPSAVYVSKLGNIQAIEITTDAMVKLNFKTDLLNKEFYITTKMLVDILEDNMQRLSNLPENIGDKQRYIRS